MTCGVVDFWSPAGTSVWFHPGWDVAGSPVHYGLNSNRRQIVAWMEPSKSSDTVLTLEFNEMVSTLNKVVRDLIVADCTDPGMGSSLMWTVPARLDQTHPSASVSSHDVRRSRGTWNSHSLQDGRAGKGDSSRWHQFAKSLRNSAMSDIATTDVRSFSLGNR